MTDSPKLTALRIDKHYPECCAINLDWHIQETLGTPLDLPECIADKLGEHWANSPDVEPDLLKLFELMIGTKYGLAHRDNSYNVENDLSGFMVWSVYAPLGCSDWCWARDTFIIVEIGAGGDPRYCSYSTAGVYRLDDDTLADSGFLDWSLGWWLQPINPDYDETLLDNLNDRIGPHYSNSPYWELERNVYFAPIWVESRECYVVRPKGVPYVCRVMPQEPCYG